MKTDIILAGVGGQGILSIAAAIGMAALKEGLHVKQAEVHGMSQRGGAVQSHLRLSSGELASDLIPMGRADLIVSVEPMEALRYLPYLSKEGWLITNSTPFVNIPAYPEMNQILEEMNKLSNRLVIDADDIALKAGNRRASNMVVLGAASAYMQIKEESFLGGIHDLFLRKGKDIIDLNIKAFDLGRKFAKEYLVQK